MNQFWILYAKKTNQMAQSKGSNWKLVTPPKMIPLFALKMLMGILNKPEEELYWVKNLMLKTSIFAKKTLYRYCKKFEKTYILLKTTHLIEKLIQIQSFARFMKFIRP